MHAAKILGSQGEESWASWLLVGLINILKTGRVVNCKNIRLSCP